VRVALVTADVVAPMEVEGEPSAWSATVASYRDHFHMAAVIFEKDARRRCFAFKYALQTPNLAGFVPPTEIRVPLPDVSTMTAEGRMQASEQRYLHVFSFERGQYVFSRGHRRRRW
jgi:hypothetical protein